MSPSKLGRRDRLNSKSASFAGDADLPLELVITGERGTTEFCRLSRLIELEYLRLLAAKESV